GPIGRGESDRETAVLRGHGRRGAARVAGRSFVRFTRLCRGGADSARGRGSHGGRDDRERASRRPVVNPPEGRRRTGRKISSKIGVPLYRTRGLKCAFDS